MRWSAGTKFDATNANRIVDSIPANYTVYLSGSTYYAEAALPGGTDYEKATATLAIQAAIDGLTGSRSWLEKVVIKGNFTIGQITIPSYTIIEIHGKLTLAAATNDDMFRPEDNATNIIIKGGVLNGNKANQTAGSSFRFSATANESYILFEDIEITGFKEHGIQLSSGTSDQIRINKCEIHTNDGSGIRAACDEVVITNCEIYSNGAAGVLAYQVHNIEVLNCFIHDNVSDGVYLSEVYHSIVENCIFSTNRAGVYILNSSYENIVNANTFEDSERQAVYIYQSSRNVVTNNICKNSSQDVDNTYDAIALEDDTTTYSTYNIVTGNQIYDDAANQSKYGIKEENAGDDYNIIENNIINGPVTANILWQGVNSLVRDNIGFVTENEGITAAIATGTAVTHGLAGTPTSITVTAAETGPTDISVDTVGAASFKINFGGGGNKTFYWQARYTV